MDKRSELLNKKKEWSTRHEKEETKQENAFFWMQITTQSLITGYKKDLLEFFEHGLD